MTDATSALLRAVNFMNFEALTVETIRSRSWASATFCGVRHEIGFRLEGEGAERAADAFLDGIEEREFDLRGHVLADIALVSRSTANGPDGPVVRIRLEALTMEAG
jgi:hypothetical protein